MAKVVIAGGGFGGVVAAEALARKLGDEHEVTLVSRSRRFVFSPALVRLAFGQCEPAEVEFDLREAMLDRKVGFVEGEVARFEPLAGQLTFAGGDLLGKMNYDFLVLAFGRRLKTEQISGFFEHAHHVLGVSEARKFGAAVANFERGHAVIGQCPGARLPVPLFETAFALARFLKNVHKREKCGITIVSNETPDEMFGGIPMSDALQSALSEHRIELVSDFAISQVNANSLIADDGRTLDFDLNMLIPPFAGPGALIGTGLTDAEGYICVEPTMQVSGVERVYAAGDCVNFRGPKTAHMAVRQGEVAAENVAAEIHGQKGTDRYDHDMMLVIDAGGNDSIFVHRNPGEEHTSILHNRFWGWVKRNHERCWKSSHA